MPPMGLAAGAGLALSWLTGHAAVLLDLREPAAWVRRRLELSRPDVIWTVPGAAAALSETGYEGAGEALVLDADPRRWTPSLPHRRASGDDLALVVFTSGTTGTPKPVALTRANLAACASAVASVHELGPNDVALNALSMAHVNAPVVALLGTAAGGGDLVMLPGFTPRRFWEVAYETGATWANLVPPLIAVLSRHRQAAPGKSRLAFVRSASAPLPVAVMRSFEEMTGIPVIETYGISEAASMVTSNLRPPRERRPGWVGWPQGVELRIIAHDDSTCPPDTAGQVIVRGPAVTPGYLGDAEATAAALRDGWLRTGDIGAMDAGGCLRIIGRQSEIINKGGEKIAPRLIEELAAAVPGVLDQAAVGVPDPIHGQEIKLFVVADSARYSAADLRQKLADELPPHFRPKEIATVGQIPRNAAGKIRRDVLISG